jgi:hypothetical protein
LARSLASLVLNVQSNGNLHLVQTTPASALPLSPASDLAHLLNSYGTLHVAVQAALVAGTQAH